MTNRLTPPPKSPHRDSFLWITIAIPCVIQIAFNIFFSFHPERDVEIALLAIALFILWLFIIFIRLLLSTWHRLPKKSLSFILSLVCLWPTSAVLKWFPAGDYVHLAWVYPNYKVQIEAHPNTRQTFNWGGFGFATTASGDRTLIYDPTDTLPQENKVKDAELCKQSHEIRNNRKYCRFRLITRHLIGHFYLVENWFL